MLNEVFNFIGAIGSLLGGIGIIFAACSLFYVSRQAKANEESTTATVYQSLVLMGDSINEMFITYPELHNELLNNTSDNSEIDVLKEQNLNPRKFWAAIRWADYFEIIKVLWPSIPDKYKSGWDQYIKYRLNQSPYIRSLISQTDWYGDDLKKLCFEIERKSVK